MHAFGKVGAQVGKFALQIVLEVPHRLLVIGGDERIQIALGHIVHRIILRAARKPVAHALFERRGVLARRRHAHALCRDEMLVFRELYKFFARVLGREPREVLAAKEKRRVPIERPHADDAVLLHDKLHRRVDADIQVARESRRAAARKQDGQHAGKRDHEHCQDARCGNERSARTRCCDGLACFADGLRCDHPLVHVGRMFFRLAAEFAFQFPSLHDPASCSLFALFLLKRVLQLFDRTRIVP